MENQESKEYKILDRIILSLFIIFILSLSNSIFINQIGYFGALLFILIKAFLTRKNQFSKTGLELAFALYMLAEIISLILSNYQAQAFHFFTKRALLIPIVYTTITVTVNLKRGKNFFILFIVGSLITSIIYLILTVQYYLSNGYNIVQSGPSLFQHTITTSEIISFTVLFLFAFIINENTSWKTKLLLYSGFLISLLTLIATYKRTGWMGVAAGIFLILIIKRKWQVLIPIFILGIIMFLTNNNISQVNVYDFEEAGVKKLFSFNTDGRATSISQFDSTFIISDYENGILFYKDSSFIKKIGVPAPIVSFSEATDSLFLAYLVNTRFLVFKKSGRELKQVNEILPPGYTKGFVTMDKALYVLDGDSGLTFYQSITTLSSPIRYPELKGYDWLFIDSLNFYLVGEKSGIAVFSQKEFQPGRIVAKCDIDGVDKAYFFDGILFIGNQDGLKMFVLDNNKIVLKDQLIELKQVHRMFGYDKTLAVLTIDGTIYKFKINHNLRFELLAKHKISPSPTNFIFSDGKLYCTYVKRSRLLSFFDPYLPQNFTRLALWRGGWEIFKDYPLFGVGDIGIEKYYVKYKRPYDKEIHGHLHNNYIHFLATLGLFGLLALSYLFTIIFVKIFRIYKLSKGAPFIASFSLGTLASFVSMLISGLSELNFWDQEIATLIYFTVGLTFALFFLYQDEQKELQN